MSPAARPAARGLDVANLQVILGLNAVVIVLGLGLALLGFDWDQALRLTPFGPPGPIHVGM